MAALDEMKKFADENGIELTDEMLDAIAGGRYSYEESHFYINESICFHTLCFFTVIPIILLEVNKHSEISCEAACTYISGLSNTLKVTAFLISDA